MSGSPDQKPSLAHGAPGPTRTPLKRNLSLPLVVLYGLGTTIGAGIYVLIGDIIGTAGAYTPIAFLLALLMAGFTAFSFAELSSRHPKSAGEAAFVQQGFRTPWLTRTVGLLMAAAVIVSGGAIVRGFTGYLISFVSAPEWLVIIALMLVLGLVAAWGILQSVIIASLITIVEIGGLIAIIAMGAPSLADLPARHAEFLPPFSWSAWGGIVSGAILAFFAFIGFESMVNVAEEVKNPRRTLPRAIIATLAITGVLYLLLALIAVLAVPPQDYAGQGAPLAFLFDRLIGADLPLLRVVGTLSTLNGAFIEIIVAARILYGLSTDRWLPRHLGHVHPRTQTPLVSTALVVLVMLLFALFVPIGTLAQVTSLVTLAVFAVTNLSLLWIKRRETSSVHTITVPSFVPMAGFAISVIFLGLEIARQLGSAIEKP